MLWPCPGPPDALVFQGQAGTIWWRAAVPVEEQPSTASPGRFNDAQSVLLKFSGRIFQYFHVVRDQYRPGKGEY